MIKQELSTRSMSSRRTAEQTSILSRAARFFSALRVFFYGFWSWRTGLSVCEDC